MSKNGLKGHTSPRGRDAGTGQFIPVKEARQSPGTSTVERVPHAGYGSDSSTTIGRDAGTGKFIPADKAQGSPNAVVERIPKPGK